MENRGISAEAYDKIKAELGIFEPLIGRTSRPAAADFWPTGAHCRTVKVHTHPAISAISLCHLVTIEHLLKVGEGRRNTILNWKGE